MCSFSFPNITVFFTLQYSCMLWTIYRNKKNQNSKRISPFGLTCTLESVVLKGPFRMRAPENICHLQYASSQYIGSHTSYSLGSLHMGYTGRCTCIWCSSSTIGMYSDPYIPHGVNHRHHNNCISPLTFFPTIGKCTPTNKVLSHIYFTSYIKYCLREASVGWTKGSTHADEIQSHDSVSLLFVSF